jgi:hypothetical protein
VIAMMPLTVSEKTKRKPPKNLLIVFSPSLFPK